MILNSRSAMGRLTWLLLVFFGLTIGNSLQAAQPSEDPDMRAFEKRYLEIHDGVRSGKLSEEVGERSKELRFVLNKAIIELNARKEMLKLEVTEFEGDRQQSALDELVNLGAERQRAIARAQHQLEALAGTAGPLPPVAPVTSAQPRERNPAGTEKNPAQSDADRARELRQLIGIEFEPEDVTKGDFE